VSAQHTPGPWVLRDRVYITQASRTEVEIAEILTSDGLYGDEPLDSVSLADACLIAAAPDLLAALVMVRDADNDAVSDGLPRIPNLARASIDAAIARATGGTVDQRTVDIPL
jgi:hypothetical protein